MKTGLCCALLLALGGSQGAAAASFAIDPAASALRFTADYGGEPIEGRFQTFSGRISYDLGNPLASRFEVEVVVASVDSGDEERDGYLRGSDWFDANAHPTARFTTRTDCSAFEGRLSCAGELALKGRTAPVTIEVQFAGDGSRLTGTAQLDRTAFDVGSGEWADPGTIGHAVEVLFEVTLKPGG